MRTENFSTPPMLAARIRAQWDRALRPLLAQGPAVRWLSALGVLAILVALGYLATVPPAGRYLGGGKSYSADEIAKITRSLDAQNIPYRVDEKRIDVSSDRHAEATEIVSKLDLGPRSLPELREKALGSGFFHSFETTLEKERRELRVREEILEATIRRIDGVVSPFVQINKVRTQRGLRPSTTMTASVLIETDGDRELTPNAVQAIQNLILVTEPELKPDTVTVYDSKFRFYLHAGNPAVGAMSRTRAREEELRRRLLEQLNWIKGVRVTVQLVHAPTPPPVVVVKEVHPPEPKIVINQPLEEPAPAAPALPPVPPAPSPAVEKELANVWVQVPRSFYHKMIPNRNPSDDDLKRFVMKTEELIRRAVTHVVPPDEVGEAVKIDAIPDNVAVRAPLEAPAVSEMRYLPSWWIPAGVAGGVTAMMVAAGFFGFAVRRPRVAPAPSANRDRFTREDAPESGPAPSERVRELIRRNPQAAASVLNRWIGQGGHAG